MSDFEEIPNEYICPITLDLMREPMVMPDGHTYEKEAIKKALEVIHVSPLTKAPMQFSDGVINYSLKSLIEKYVKEHNIHLNDIEEKIKNLTFQETSMEPVEFEELFARVISEDESDGLCKDSLHIYMKPKPIPKTSPLCLICVVDISGSMTMNCCENIENMESMYISRLDLIKHTLKTIVSTLRKEDIISVITFNGNSSIAVRPTVLTTPSVKEEVINNINEMRATGMTNIWSGIKEAIDISATIESNHYQKSIMVFTDGDSNSNPPQGVYQALKETLSVSNDNFTISTFSFGVGRDVDPKLLIDIANLGNGIYGYCPDGTMVGTIFINYMANLLSTITPIVKVNVTQGEGTKKKTMTLGPLYRSSYRNAIFKVNSQLLDQTKVTVELPFTQQILELPIQRESPDLQGYIKDMMEEERKQRETLNPNGDDDEDELLDDDDSDDETVGKVEDIDTNALIVEKNIEPDKYEERLFNQIIRNKFIIFLHKILNQEEKDMTKFVLNKEKDMTKSVLNDFLVMLKGLQYKTKFVKNLIVDIEHSDPNHGQVEKALRPEYFYSWGISYLNSFLRFHQYEQCGNFKDLSLQYYSNEVFETYRKMANTIFINLPPPQTTMRIEYDSPPPHTNSFRTNRFVRFLGAFSNANASAQALASAPIRDQTSTPVNMSSFLNRHGGCFNGEAIVLLDQNQFKSVKDLRKGDRLKNGAIVECLIEQNCDTGSSYMCDINGVLFTPYHPIELNDIWYFPVDLVAPKSVPISSWYNLIVKDETHQKFEVEFANGITAITLGHYRTENRILKHPYFGTDAVLKDLQERDPLGYANGYIYIQEIRARQLQFDEQNYCINYYKVSPIILDDSINIEVSQQEITV